MNFRRQPNDPAWDIFRHLFLHRNGHAAQIEAVLLRGHRHDRAHAGAERGGNEIGRRKRFAFALIVGWRVRPNFGLRRTVRRVAMQVASVFDGDVDHEMIMRCNPQPVILNGVKDHALGVWSFLRPMEIKEFV